MQVFYLLSTRLPNNLRDAYDIFYIANTRFWGSSTKFHEAAELTLQAVEEMHQGLHLGFNYSWIDIQIIVDAFAEVGICCSKSSKSTETWDCTLLNSKSQTCPHFETLFASALFGLCLFYCKVSSMAPRLLPLLCREKIYIL